MAMKKRHSRGRTGCVTCRIRHVKCDETKPDCLRCSKTGRKCDGYVDKTWRFEPPSKVEKKQIVISVDNASSTPKRLSSKLAANSEEDTVSSRDSTDTSGSDLTLRNSALQRDVQIISTPDLRKPYMLAFLASLRCRLLPDRVSLPPSTVSDLPAPSQAVTPCAIWVTTACNLVADRTSGALQNALVAVALSMLGCEDDKTHLTPTALEMYRRSLRGIRQELQVLLTGTWTSTPSSTEAQELFLSCHAIAMFELFVNRSWSDTMKHIRGIGSFITHLTNQGCKTMMGDLLLQDYRLFELPFCLLERSPSSWNRAAAAAVRGGRKAKANSKTTQSVTHDLLDLGDRIVLLIVQYDDVFKRLSIDPVSSDGALKRLLNELLQTISDIDDWVKKFHSTFDPVLLPTSADDIESNYNQLPFSKFELSVPWVYASMFKVGGLDTCIRILHLFLNPTFPSSSAAAAAASATAATIPSLCSLQPTPPKPTTRSSTCLPLLTTPIITTTILPRLRTQLQISTHLLSRCLPYLLSLDKGAAGRSIAIFPLEVAFRSIEAEATRLQDDICLERDRKGRRNVVASSVVGAGTGPGTGCELTRAIEQNAADLERCKAMEAKAKMFGLPLYADR